MKEETICCKKCNNPSLSYKILCADCPCHRKNLDLQKRIKIEKSLPKNYPGCPKRNMKRPCEDIEGLKICYYCGKDLLKTNQPSVVE